MKIIIRSELKLALTIGFVLAIYFQSISNPFSLFDDPYILEFYGTNSNLSFLDVITPGAGFYYRPIITLSYWLDSQMWGLDPTFMHLENIIIHLVNVLLVFLIASRLPFSENNKSFPFISALLFGLHPINSESVNWIAGRTDIFAAAFILLAAYCLICAIQRQSTRLAIIAFGVAFLGMLAKETAGMFVPAAFLMITNWPALSYGASSYRTWRLRILIPIAISLCSCSALLVLVFMKRRGDNAISMIFEGGTNVFIRVFEALGFYVKKIFMPIPLNLAIVEVDHFYIFCGVITLVILIVMFRRVGIPAIFIASAVMFTIPALIVATISIAWTPYGERYLYIPSAFAVIGCLELLHRFLVRWNVVKWFLPISVIIIITFSTITFQRGRLWGDNFAMIQDIVAKSPNFGVARNEYGVLLKQAGFYEEAEKQFSIAVEQKNQANVERMIRLNLIGMKILGKKPVEVRRILLLEIGDKAHGDVELLKLINRFNEYLLNDETSLEHKRKIIAEITDTNDNLYLKTHDPFYFYRSGQLALSIGNKKEAAVFFRKAWENARQDAYYREPARKLAKELSAK